MALLSFEGIFRNCVQQPIMTQVNHSYQTLNYFFKMSNSLTTYSNVKRPLKLRYHLKVSPLALSLGENPIVNGIYFFLHSPFHSTIALSLCGWLYSLSLPPFFFSTLAFSLLTDSHPRREHSEIYSFPSLPPCNR